MTSWTRLWRFAPIGDESPGSRTPPADLLGKPEDGCDTFNDAANVEYTPVLGRIDRVCLSEQQPVMLLQPGAKRPPHG